MSTNNHPVPGGHVTHLKKTNKLYLFILGCTESWVLCRLLSSCSEWGLLSSCSVWASHSGGFSCCRAQALGLLGSRSCSSRTLESTGSIVVAHGLSCSTACGIFLAQGSNMCVLHWQVDSLLLTLQEALMWPIFKDMCCDACWGSLGRKHYVLVARDRESQKEMAPL